MIGLVYSIDLDVRMSSAWGGLEWVYVFSWEANPRCLFRPSKPIHAVRKEGKERSSSRSAPRGSGIAAVLPLF